jgi:hypothetical protein
VHSGMLSRPTTRRFGDYGWAWPSGSFDQLLKAALVPYEERALAAAKDWLHRHDIDLASAADHGLLALICGRFGEAIADDPAYPRLLGLRRQRWTRSRLVGGEAEPVLNAIMRSGIPLLLIKGAALVASDASAGSPPLSNGIDIVVGGQHLPAALAILQRLGWQATSGASWQYLATCPQASPSMRFFAGVYGELDLHSEAYPSTRNEPDEERLWRQALAAKYHGVPVLVPSAPDAAALAIAHGTVGGAVDVEWIVDCARALSTEGFSWSEFSGIVERRGLSVPARIVLSYLSQEIGIPVPAAVLQRATVAADRSGSWTRLGFLLRVRPRRDMSRATALARWLARKSQRRQQRKSRVATSVQPLFRGRRLPQRSARAPANTLATRHLLDLSPLASSDGMMSVRLLIETAAPELPRRLAWEINGVSRHIARLRYRAIRRGKAPLVVRFDGLARFDSCDLPLTIEARPIGRIRQDEGETATARYGALPFRVLEAQIAPCDRP